MRNIFILMCLLPFLSIAQINRSANELAQEGIREYLKSRILKGQSFNSLSFAELKSRKNIEYGVEWTMEIRLQIEETRKISSEKTIVVQQPYQFIFYLNKKLEVVKATSVHYQNE